MNRTVNTLFLLLLSSLGSRAQTVDTIIKGAYTGFTYNLSIFPGTWREAPINAMGEQVSPDEIPRSKSVISRSLDKYPASTLKEIKAVYFLGQLKFFNVPYGGTNSFDVVYLVNRGVGRGYSDKFLEQTFHHEFSSILLRNYPQLLDTNLWKNANDPSFVYNDPENGVGAIRNNKISQELDSALCEKGILTQYGLSSVENDINTFALNLFSPEKNFWNFVNRFPRIRQKTNQLINFYLKINSVFTEQYFRQFENQ